MPTTTIAPRDWKRQKALLEDEAKELEKKGIRTNSALYQSVSLILSELDELTIRLAHEEKRIQDMVHQVAGLESRVHEEVE